MEITTLSISQEWKKAPPMWGHPLHSMCSYMAMFPPSVPHTFIEWLTKPQDAVYDPFSGRGTTALEACIMGRVGYGSDLNPMADVLTGAKVDPPEWQDVERRLAEIRRKIRPLAIEAEPEPIRAIFAPGTLGQLLWLRENLSSTSRVDRFLMGVLLGILHLGSDSSGKPRGLSVSMPNAFAMAPGYVMNYIVDHGLEALEVDVIKLLAARAGKYMDSLEHATCGAMWMQDAAAQGWLEQNGLQPNLIFTSPPYLHIMKYGKYNWIRLWMLGEEAREVDQHLFSTSSLPKYLTFMDAVIARLAAVVHDRGRICLVVGDVAQGDKTVRLAEEIARSCVPGSLRVDGIVVDELADNRKVSRIWGDSKGNATKTDRILILSKKRAPRLPVMPDMSWTQ